MNNHATIINVVTLLFLLIWGAYERVSAIRKEKIHAGSENRDSYSLIIFYSTIFLGYGIGIPVSFAGYGKIEALFPYISLAGFLVIATGLSIRLMAIRTLAEHFTYTVKIIDNHQLITSGIYKYIRHPSYLGQSLIFLGCGLAFANWLSIVFLFLPNFLAALYRISIEEKVLINHFNDQYLEYMERTKLLVPWIY
ncbi:MAG TPA: isoprenylcysteine carboxylmethyltransferase family protein [Spirochaetota bacterium]|nr:isoprenylcysteine carboxylmethyltransferase family protein [Spirochaetota bacterium]HPC39870.1 isoprenylcysteine carboxylmethyltransferase family protein [Spirochaetota bacterium]HPL17800.1 isoprenylcysteine carboxylmethyltransferase family protein [Spirochaetota bacterium]HQF08954.1 isoprenylcysteine carboxylmethyltransferase family protein [Spirochaetota bacterium]HQH98762.1 isoprenylcysteine carboxylmethyltransferase family protein [Spirochaetota bacterium]